MSISLPLSAQPALLVLAHRLQHLAHLAHGHQPVLEPDQLHVPPQHAQPGPTRSQALGLGLGQGHLTQNQQEDLVVPEVVQVLADSLHVFPALTQLTHLLPQIRPAHGPVRNRVQASHVAPELAHGHGTAITNVVHSRIDVHASFPLIRALAGLGIHLELPAITVLEVNSSAADHGHGHLTLDRELGPVALGHALPLPIVEHVHAPGRRTRAHLLVTQGDGPLRDVATVVRLERQASADVEVGGGTAVHGQIRAPGPVSISLDPQPGLTSQPLGSTTSRLVRTAGQPDQHAQQRHHHRDLFHVVPPSVAVALLVATNLLWFFVLRVVLHDHHIYSANTFFLEKHLEIQLRLDRCLASLTSHVHVHFQTATTTLIHTRLRLRLDLGQIGFQLRHVVVGTKLLNDLEFFELGLIFATTAASHGYEKQQKQPIFHGTIPSLAYTTYNFQPLLSTQKRR